ncbi:FAD-binding domain-containing protein [Cereibacter sphaeroides]|uniref:FAD-binding domain-containing protein n=1 Tax=Cereibacter sphaeroides TaxID=1063 RepID=UPI001F269AA8|nr:FAD-binding domain-containing protein [Cereibacter sphaeroides]MCE6968032.1 deoxyribodipyrimidine photo-lyase [Cereibacter sphaeroides]
MNVLVWFRNDLRVTDHPALALAAEARVLPLHIIDPEDWADAARSARQWMFRAECLVELRETLARLGAPLAVRVGDPVAVLDTLCRLHRIRRILCLEDAASRATDQRVAAWAATAGVELVVVPQGPGAPAALSPVPAVEPGPIPPPRALRLAEDRCPHRQPGGREQGLLLLQGFLERRGEAYREARDRPLLAERLSSRLSPHLAAGCLSRAEVAEALARRLAERPGPGWTRSLAAFRTALAQTAEGAAPSDTGADAAHLGAFQRAETGLPFVDAALRCLDATGWLPARMRAMLASVALHHLGLPQRPAGAALACRLTDFAPPVHWAQMERAAGRGPADPIALAAVLDRDGRFTRRWLPELADVPDALLQEPWRWTGARRLLGHRYPEAVVDPASTAREARRRLMRRAAGTADLVDWRGARPARARRVPVSPAQLHLDL